MSKPWKLSYSAQFKERGGRMHDGLHFEQWYELGPPGLVYSGTRVIGSPCFRERPLRTSKANTAHLRRVVLLGHLDELDGDCVVVELRNSLDERGDVCHDGASEI